MKHLRKEGATAIVLKSGRLAPPERVIAMLVIDIDVAVRLMLVSLNFVNLSLMSGL